MIADAIRLLVAACVVAAALPAAASELRFAYLSRDDDPAYRMVKAYTGLVLRRLHRPLDGARLAIKESQIIGRSAGMTVSLSERPLAAGETADAVIGDLRRDGWARMFILDLPLEEVVAAGQAAAGLDDVVLLNVRHRDDRLRAGACSAALWHVAPSDAMVADGLAQYLSARNWRRVLVLVGADERDRAASAAFARAARKFGLEIADTRAFRLSNDPRLRDQTNTLLLTGDARYDAVALFDEVGEFGRYLPFATYLPRPVVGSEGLVAGAWHWTWERHGAPQLNQRFEKLAGRPMGDADWAGWVAVKAIVEAAVKAKTVDSAGIRRALVSDEIAIDFYKGTPGNFRAWDRQLRQPVLLHTHNAVIARAPLDGFLHRSNNLDTLGLDAPETGCRQPTK